MAMKKTDCFGFSAVSLCLFCQRDALHPQVDARGDVGLLVFRNLSFRYTCERCKRRSWYLERDLNSLLWVLNGFGEVPGKYYIIRCLKKATVEGIREARVYSVALATVP